jgi:hypothetical protein
VVYTSPVSGHGTYVVSSRASLPVRTRDRDSNLNSSVALEQRHLQRGGRVGNEIAGAKARQLADNTPNMQNAGLASGSRRTRS